MPSWKKISSAGIFAGSQTPPHHFTLGTRAKITLLVDGEGQRRQNPNHW